MNKGLSKRYIIPLLILLIIATIIYTFVLQSTFREGRTAYLPRGREEPGRVTIDTNGRPWVTTYPFHNIMVLEKDTWIPHDLPPKFNLTSITADRSGKIWAGSDNSGLLMFDGENWQILNTSSSGIASNAIHDLVIDELDRVWIIYEFWGWEEIPAIGVSTFDGANWITYTKDNSGLTSNEVTSVAFDANNRAWISTTENIFSYDDDQWTTHTLAIDVSEHYIDSIMVDDLGRVWANISSRRGLGDIDLFVFNGEDWSDYNPSDISTCSCTHIVRLLFIDSVGRLWFECEIDGSYRVSRLWRDSERGIRIYDGHTWVSYVEDDGYNNEVYDFARDEQGWIWITDGYNRGLTSLEPDYDFSMAERIQFQRVFLRSGGLNFITLVLGILLVASVREVFPFVYVAAMIGFAVTLGFALLFNEPHIIVEFGRGYSGVWYILNPGILITIAGILGAFIGARKLEEGHTPPQVFNKSMVIGLLVGFILGIGLDFLIMIIWAFAIWG